MAGLSGFALQPVASSRPSRRNRPVNPLGQLLQSSLARELASVKGWAKASVRATGWALESVRVTGLATLPEKGRALAKDLAKARGLATALRSVRALESVLERGLALEKAPATAKERATELVTAPRNLI